MKLNMKEKIYSKDACGHLVYVARIKYRTNGHGPSWDDMGQPWTTWDNLAQPGTTWDDLGQPGTTWTTWDDLGRHETAREHLARPALIWV